MTESCATCRFYAWGACHRRAPVRRGLMDYHFGELLEAIALAELKLAGMSNYFEDETDHAINTEVTEAFVGSPWPCVEDTSWCGEYEPGGPHE